MEEQNYQLLCSSLANALSVGVRLYREECLVYYDSIYHLEPDSVEIYLDQLLTNDHSVGIITTSLYQFYGFLTLPKGYRLILGPTSILHDDAQELVKLFKQLGISQGDQAEYRQQLRSAPLINKERFAWLLVVLATALVGETSVADVWIQSQPASNPNQVKKEYIEKQIASEDDLIVSRAVQQSYAWEQLVGSYIQEGRPDVIHDLFIAPPKIEAGKMSYDTLRQSKNSGICAAALATRHAISGGMGIVEAFRMSDLYIQKIELLYDFSSVEKLTQEMLIDFAENVKENQHKNKEKQPIYNLCVNYVIQHIFSTIRVEEMARDLGYSRAYLCHQFKKQAGVSLSQYILQEKILASKKMIQFTDKSLSQIAALFGFSSQSHFQTVFKQMTEETPLAYRKRTLY